MSTRAKRPLARSMPGESTEGRVSRALRLVAESEGMPLDGRHITVVGLVILAFAIRIHNLDAQSIWWDEAISIHLARSGVREIVANRAANLHPPLYFFLLKLWRYCVGDSPFAVRFLSVWLSIPLIPSLYRFGRRWLTIRAGLVATALAAFSPLYLVYAQEARVYALLPLVYLVLLALRFSLIQPSDRTNWLVWTLLGGVELLALGLHYVSLFAVGYVVVTLLVEFRNNRANRNRVLIVQAGVVLALIPWLLAVLWNIDAVSRRLPKGNWGVEPITLTHFVRLLWTFQMTGLTGLIADPVATALTTLTALILVGALIRLLLGSSALACRSATARLLTDWLIPLGSTFVVWHIRPLSHPRYVILFTPALLLTGGHVLDRFLDGAFVERVGAAVLAIFLLSTSILGIHTYCTEFRKDDTRGAAQVIAARAGADDVILVPQEDWSIPYYYDGPTRVEMMWPRDSSAGWRRFEELTGKGKTVFLVGYTHGTHIGRSILPFALEAAGSLVERWESDGIHVQVYDLDRSVTLPDLISVSARFDPLRLTGVWIEEGPPANTAVSVALRWRLREPCDTPLRAALRLRDGSGWMWGSADDWLLTNEGLTTEEWQAGQEITTYHVVPLPPGTPVVTCTLSLSVYGLEGDVVESLDLLDEGGSFKGQSLDVGTSSLSTPLRVQDDPYDQAQRVPVWESPVELGPGLVLLGASVDRQTAGPGQSVFVALSWEKRGAPPADTHITLEVEQEGETLVTEVRPIGGSYPVQRWAIGQMVVDHQALDLPHDVEGGPVQVLVRVGAQRVEVGEVDVEGIERTFTRPPMHHRLDVQFGDVAELLGYDLARTELAAGKSARVVLYWRALDQADAADYKVFAHLLDPDGDLVGQHDGRPAGGTRPTQGWVPGEIVTDPHEMVFHGPYLGSVHIAVGLYEAASLDRVPVAGDGTFVLLPSDLTVSEE